MKHASHIHGKKPASSKEKEYLEGWQRSRAELDNFRKRIQASQGESRERLKRELITSLLSLADNFSAITNHVPADLKDNSWVQGVLHVGRQLDQLLQEFGLEKIGQVSEPFDPVRHEAIAHVKDEKAPPDTVVSVVSPGYKLGQTVIRPAKVSVSSD